MSEKQQIVGLTPWLPWPLSTSPWWTEPIPAERLAAMRIGLAAVLLCDLLLNYYPNFALFYGPGRLFSNEVFPHSSEPPLLSWSLLRGVEDLRVLWCAFDIWVVATVFLLVGFCSRPSAVVCWALSVSFIKLNYHIHNAGDIIRNCGLFYVMLGPCGAAWSVDAWLRRWWQRQRGRTEDANRQVLIAPWSVRLVLVHLAVIYFVNGLYKLLGPEWRGGTSLHYVLGELSGARWSAAQLPLPDFMLRLMTWSALGFELSFPLLLLRPLLRAPALCFGVAFHLGIFLLMELGVFPLYAICLYLPEAPWERLPGLLSWAVGQRSPTLDKG